MKSCTEGHSLTSSTQSKAGPVSELARCSGRRQHPRKWHVCLYGEAHGRPSGKNSAEISSNEDIPKSHVCSASEGLMTLFNGLPMLSTSCWAMQITTAAHAKRPLGCCSNRRVTAPRDNGPPSRITSRSGSIHLTTAQPPPVLGKHLDRRDAAGPTHQHHLEPRYMCPLGWREYCKAGHAASSTDRRKGEASRMNFDGLNTSDRFIASCLTTAAEVGTATTWTVHGVGSV